MVARNQLFFVYILASRSRGRDTLVIHTDSMHFLILFCFVWLGAFNYTFIFIVFFTVFGLKLVDW